MQQEVNHKTIEEMEAELTPQEYARYQDLLAQVGPIGLLFGKN
jgi:hypothetical protein